MTTTHLARMVEAFNAGHLDEVVAHTTDDYYYIDPIGGRVDGAAAHAAHMQTILHRFPDRKIEILRSWVANGAEFGEDRWTATPADGGDPKELIFATVIELDGDRLRRWANFTG